MVLEIADDFDLTRIAESGQCFRWEPAPDGSYRVLNRAECVYVRRLGERTFEQWMTTSPSPESMIERIGRDFQLGGHKAAAIAITLQKAKIFLVSELEDDFVRSIFLTPMPSAQAALDQAFTELGADASVLAMPFGGSTLPRVVGKP